MHWKNKDRRIKELAADERESELVKLVFSLYINRQMGYRKIIDYLNLNGFRTRAGKIFGVSTIQRMLENPIYIGRKRYKSFDGTMTEQPINEMLRIISDDTFNQVLEIKRKRKEKLNEQDKLGIPLAGRLLFSGVAYCHYCGAKLVGSYLYRKQKKQKNNRPYTNAVYRYRCPLNKGKYYCNHKQNLWGAKKHDNITIDEVKNMLKQIDISSFIDNVEEKKNQD